MGLGLGLRLGSEQKQLYLRQQLVQPLADDAAPDPVQTWWCREQDGSALGQLALRRLLSATNTPQAPASLGQPAAWSALAGHIGPCFRPRHRPQAPLSKAPDSSHSASARSSARSMSTSHAASVAASAPAYMQMKRRVGTVPTVWDLGAWRACGASGVRGVWSFGARCLHWRRSMGRWRGRRAWRAR